MRILSVDDRDENRYLIEALLRGNGYQVTSVANGAEAITQLQSSKFDLIISDILMPVMDGFQLCRKIKADENLCHIPFIFYTATYTGPQDEAFALKIGGDKFIQKPCEPDIFIEAIKQVLQKDENTSTLLQCEPQAPDEEVLKLYSERLVRKLEQKMLQLEQEAKARRQTEEVLRQSEMKYRHLYNSIRDAIVVAGTDRTIVDCNQAFIDQFGYSLTEVVGKKTLVLYESEEEYRRIGNALKNHDDNSTHLYTLHFKKKNGTVFPGEINVYLLRDDGGAIVGFIGLIRDITERVRAETVQKNLESQLHQAQKIESVGRLAGGVAHDYNNMLSVIVGYSELALKKLDPSDNLYGDLREIHKAAIRSTDITRQLLAFARKQTIDPVALDLNETVESALKMLRRLIGEDVDLAWLPDTSLWPVKMDPSQLGQILANLCVNARDAINGVGRITIETHAKSFDESYCTDHPGFVPGDYVLLTVSDNGCGMDRNTADKIFEPFFTTKGVGKGTGLGLATVYGIIKQNNGFINVYSEPGKGTSFNIYLSRHTEAIEDLPETNPVAIPRGRGQTVLVVEDEISILKLAKKILTDLGYQVLTAESPNQALRLARQQQPALDLLIVDVVMPEMNGKELTELLARGCSGFQTLFMSGYTADVIAHHGVLEKGVNFIQKPFSTNDLAAKVHEILSL